METDEGERNRTGGSSLLIFDLHTCLHPLVNTLRPPPVKKSAFAKCVLSVVLELSPRSSLRKAVLGDILPTWRGVLEEEDIRYDAVSVLPAGLRACYPRVALSYQEEIRAAAQVIAQPLSPVKTKEQSKEAKEREEAERKEREEARRTLERAKQGKTEAPKDFLKLYYSFVNFTSSIAPYRSCGRIGPFDVEFRASAGHQATDSTQARAENQKGRRGKDFAVSGLYWQWDAVLSPSLSSLKNCGV
jgi:hypothetical protein